MKQRALTLQEIIAFAGSIAAGNSLPVIQTNLGPKALKRRVHYVTGFLNQIGTNGGEILLPQVAASPGVKSIDKNMLPSGMPFLPCGVRVLFDTTAGVQVAGIGTAIWASVAPANFKNGEFSISQNGNVCDAGGTAVTNFKASTGNDDDYLELSPVILRDNTAISMRMLLGAAAAIDQAFKVEIIGYDLVDPSKA